MAACNSRCAGAGVHSVRIPRSARNAMLALAALFIAPSILGCNRAEERRAAVDVPTNAARRELGTVREALISTTELPASGDTHLQNGLPNQNFGGDTQLSIQALGNRRALLFFDPQAWWRPWVTVRWCQRGLS